MRSFALAFIAVVASAAQSEQETEANYYATPPSYMGREMTPYEHHATATAAAYGQPMPLYDHTAYNTTPMDYAPVYHHLARHYSPHHVPLPVGHEEAHYMTEEYPDHYYGGPAVHGAYGPGYGYAPHHGDYYGGHAAAYPYGGPVVAPHDPLRHMHSYGAPHPYGVHYSYITHHEGEGSHNLRYEPYAEPKKVASTHHEDVDHKATASERHEASVHHTIQHQPVVVATVDSEPAKAQNTDDQSANYGYYGYPDYGYDGYARGYSHAYGDNVAGSQPIQGEDADTTGWNTVHGDVRPYMPTDTYSYNEAEDPNFAHGDVAADFKHRTYGFLQ